MAIMLSAFVRKGSRVPALWCAGVGSMRIHCFVKLVEAIKLARDFTPTSTFISTFM